MEAPSLWGGMQAMPAWTAELVTRSELITEPLQLFLQRSQKSKTKAARGPNGAMLTMYGKSCEPGAVCGACAFLVRVRYHCQNYYKCQKHGMSHGTGTDHRLKWQACALFVERTGDIGERDVGW